MSGQIPLFPPPLADQLKEQRRTVDFDNYDIHVLQLLAMLERRQIGMAPAYQRKFRWKEDRCSSLIESLLLGIPIPNLFMATNPDGDWEVVDGVQRLSAIVKFAGNERLRNEMGVGESLKLQDLNKLTSFNGLSYDRLPASVRAHFETRPVRVVTLNDKSNLVVRFDLFERLNTGGVILTHQEIRDCVYRGPFADSLEKWAGNENFRKVVRLTELQQKDGTSEECVLRYFAFRDGYQKFDHSVIDFLNDYMEKASKDFDRDANGKDFERTFKELARVLPNGLTRRGSRKGTTSLILYEGIAVGAALALRQRQDLVSKDVDSWLASADLRKHTTGATNNRAAVIGRIEFCRDRFLGKKYVPSTSN